MGKTQNIIHFVPKQIIIYKAKFQEKREKTSTARISTWLFSLFYVINSLFAFYTQERNVFQTLIVNIPSILFASLRSQFTPIPYP